MRQILLTGGSGFIGKNVLEYLPGKYKIFAPSHFELNLLDRQAVARFLSNHSIDAVIHAAGVGASRADGEDGVFENNKNIFLNLVENQAKFKRLIFLGSGAEYGKQRPIVKIKEGEFGQVKPEDEYGQAKYFASEYIASSQNVINLRLFGIFGKNEDYQTRFISNAICRALFGLSILLRQNARFEYVYIKDLVRIVDYFLNLEPEYKFYNVGSGQSVELLELAKIVQAATGGKSKIEIKNPGLNKEYTCDSSRLKAELGKFEFTPFEQAIIEMVEYYIGILPTLKKEDLGFDE